MGGLTPTKEHYKDKPSPQITKQNRKILSRPCRYHFFLYFWLTKRTYIK